MVSRSRIYMITLFIAIAVEAKHDILAKYRNRDISQLQLYELPTIAHIIDDLFFDRAMLPAHADITLAIQALQEYLIRQTKLTPTKQQQMLQRLQRLQSLENIYLPLNIGTATNPLWQKPSEAIVLMRIMEVRNYHKFQQQHQRIARTVQRLAQEQRRLQHQLFLARCTHLPEKKITLLQQQLNDCNDALRNAQQELQDFTEE
ncbi:hypothetical protein M1466_03245 [Candidatus Dependentiae bacterium]|nr:hypothetical protein [Candidatus Dependentiae bacterium]